MHKHVCQSTEGVKRGISSAVNHHGDGEWRDYTLWLRRIVAPVDAQTHTLEGLTNWHFLSGGGQCTVNIITTYRPTNILPLSVSVYLVPVFTLKPSACFSLKECLNIQSEKQPFGKKIFHSFSPWAHTSVHFCHLFLLIY